MLFNSLVALNITCVIIFIIELFIVNKDLAEDKEPDKLSINMLYISIIYICVFSTILSIKWLI